MATEKFDFRSLFFVRRIDEQEGLSLFISKQDYHYIDNSYIINFVILFIFFCEVVDIECRTLVKPENCKVSSDALKIIATICMLIDHIALVFLSPNLPIYFIFRFIGRFTAPTMCMLLADGYRYTRSKKKYLLRLFVAALVSHPIYAFVNHKSLLAIPYNMMYTFCICVLILAVYERYKNIERVAIIGLLWLLTCFCTWGMIAPIWTLLFYIFKENKRKTVVAFIISSTIYIATNVLYPLFNGLDSQMWIMGIYMVVPAILMYSGERKIKGKAFSLFFYVFYPLHLLILGLIFEWLKNRG